MGSDRLEVLQEPGLVSCIEVRQVLYWRFLEDICKFLLVVFLGGYKSYNSCKRSKNS